MQRRSGVWSLLPRCQPPLQLGVLPAAACRQCHCALCRKVHFREVASVSSWNNPHLSRWERRVGLPAGCQPVFGVLPAGDGAEASARAAKVRALCVHVDRCQRLVLLPPVRIARLRGR